jgi:hypothetical protein
LAAAEAEAGERSDGFEIRSSSNDGSVMLDGRSSEPDAAACDDDVRGGDSTFDRCEGSRGGLVLCLRMTESAPTTLSNISDDESDDPESERDRESALGSSSGSKLP